MLEPLILVCALIQLGSPPLLAKKIAPIIIAEGKRREISPSLISAIIKHESRFRPHVKSKSADSGLMQIHCPRTDYMWWCKYPKRLLKLKFNIRIGTKILQLKKERCKERKDWLKCYNPYSKGYAEKIRVIETEITTLVNRCKLLQ